MPASMEWKSLGLVLLGVVLGYMLGRSPPQHDALAGRFPGKVLALEDIESVPVNHDRVVESAGTITKQVLLKNGDVPHLTGFSQAHVPPGQIVSEHAHATMHEVFFVEEGAGEFVINDKATPVHKGSCIHLAAGDRHRIENTGRGDLTLTYFGVAID